MYTIPASLETVSWTVALTYVEASTKGTDGHRKIDQQKNQQLVLTAAHKLRFWLLKYQRWKPVSF